MKPALLLTALLIAGCQGGSPVGSAAKDASQDPTPVGPPADPGPSKLFLVGENTLLRLGDDAGDAQKAFPPPKGSFPITDLPDQFRAPYSARGWDAAHQGFGIVLYEERIVCAMTQNEQVDRSVAEELRSRYDRELASITPVEVDSDAANYVFWEDQNQRLMLLVQKAGDKVRTTVALGDKTVMDALGANVERARQDGQQLDALLRESREKADDSTPANVGNGVPQGQGGGASSNEHR